MTATRTTRPVRAGPRRAARALNPWIEGHLRRLGQARPVLDVGCGRGFWLDRMSDDALDAIGVEYRFERAREYAGSQPIVVGDATSLPLPDAAAGMVWCIHVLHHLTHPARALAEMRRVLRPGGHLVIAETVEDHPLIRIGRQVRPRWDGVPVESRYTRSAFEQLLGDAGFETVDIRQHSIVSWAAWGLPIGAAATWRGLTHVERLVPARWNRWGAHVEVVARASDVPSGTMPAR